jgi:hypothetical protein
MRPQTARSVRFKSENMTLNRLLVFSIAFVLVDCGGSSQFASEPLSCETCFLVTDATEYTATPIVGEGALVHKRYHFPVISTFTNRSADTVFLGRCFPDSKQPMFTVVGIDSASAFDYRTESAYSAAWACVGHDRQIEIAPGQVRVDTLDIEGPNSFSGTTGVAHGILEGTFRLYFVARNGRDERSPLLPFAKLTSNSFTVRLAK